MYIFIYECLYLYYIGTCNHLAVILSSDPPQPIDLLSAYLFICMYVYIYIYMYIYICMYVFIIKIYIFTCNHLQSFQVQTHNLLTYCLPAYLSICMYIYIYMYLFIFILIIYLQSPAVILSSDPSQPIDLLSACLPIYLYIYISIYIIFRFETTYCLRVACWLLVIVYFIWTRR